MQIFSGDTQETLKEFFLPIVSTHQTNTNVTIYQSKRAVTSDVIRLWKFTELNTVGDVFKYLYDATRKFTSFEYRLKSPMALLERDEDNDKTV